MSLTPEQFELLEQLERATNEYVDNERDKLQKRANFLRRLNTRIDDFQNIVELELTQIAISNIGVMVD